MTAQDKIAILKDIDWNDMIIRGSGLCIMIDEAMERKFPETLPYAMAVLRGKIELFSYSLSKQFSTYNDACERWYWFATEGKKGYKERRKYVNWMIDEYKKSLN